MNLLQCYYNLQLYIISLGPQLPPLKIKTPVRLNIVSMRERVLQDEVNSWSIHCQGYLWTLGRSIHQQRIS